MVRVVAVAGVQGWRAYADRRAAAYGRTLYQLRGEQDKLKVDAIDGIKVVKAHVLESHMVRRLDALLADELKPELRLVFFQCGPLLVNEVLAMGLVIVLGEVVPVRAHIQQIPALSAHADADGILAWLRTAPRPPKAVYVTHGEPPAQAALKARIEAELGWRVIVPEPDDVVEV